jgi:hypothetical protein
MSAIKSEKFNIYNPLCSNNKTIQHEDKEVQLTIYNLSKYIEKVYILCPLRNSNDLCELYYRYISDTTLKKLSDYLVLYSVVPYFLKNEVHFNSIVSVKSKNFMCFNKFGLELPEDIIILPILHINFLNIQSYLKLFESSNLKELWNTIFVGNYFNNSFDNMVISDYLVGIISSLNESKYWTFEFNCTLNLNTLFNMKQKKKFVIKLLDKKDDMSKNSDDSSKNQCDYMQFIFQKNKNFKDISRIIKLNKMNTFNVSTLCEYTNEDINNLFDKLSNDYQQYILFCNLLVSKKYTHLVINNKYILTKLKPMINEYAELFRYLIGYSWATLYYEECIKKLTLKKDDRCVFSLFTAACLPIYPFNHLEPQKNPYMPLPISSKVLNPQNNVGGFPCYLEQELHHKGLVESKEEYMKIFNVFCTGNCNNNLFANIDFKTNKIGITGSIIAATVFKEPFLKSMFTNLADLTGDNKFNFEWNRYFAEFFCTKQVHDKNNDTYVKKSDIDVMIETNDDFEFIEKFYYIHNQVVVNILSYSEDSVADYVKPKIVKTLTIYVDYDFIKKYICNDELTIKIVCCNIEDSRIVKLFIPYIEKLYNDYINNKFKDFDNEELNKLKENYPSYFDTVESDQLEMLYKIRISDNSSYSFVREVVSNKKLKFDRIIEENYILRSVEIKRLIANNKINKSDMKIYIGFKGYIKSPYMNHQLEIYKVKDLMSVCTMHHYSWVRAYFDGDDILCTTSCISGLLTGHTPDIRWHSCEAIREETHCKWIHRGLSMYLNQSEINDLINYIKNNYYWSSLFGIDKNENINKLLKDKRVIGLKGISSKIYRPRLYMPDYYREAPFVDLVNAYNDKSCRNKYKHVHNNSTFKKLMKLKFNCRSLDLMNKCVYDLKTGSMNPLDLDIIKTVYKSDYTTRGELTGEGGRL